MLAAGGWKIFKALHHPSPLAPPREMGDGSARHCRSRIVSFIAVKWLLRYVQSPHVQRLRWYASPWPW